MGIAQENANGRSQTSKITRDRLAELLNEDLAREYQAIIAYVVYSQVLKGAEYMNIADQLEIHAKQELDHALMISRQIDYLGKMPTVTPKPVKTSKDAEGDAALRSRQRERNDPQLPRPRPAMRGARRIRAWPSRFARSSMQEQDHQIDLATALGIEVPDMGKPAG